MELNLCSYITDDFKATDAVDDDNGEEEEDSDATAEQGSTEDEDTPAEDEEVNEDVSCLFFKLVIFGKNFL